jgi:thioredoxin 2
MPILICSKCGAKNRVDDHVSAERQPVCGRCHAPLIAGPGQSPVTLTDATIESFIASAGDVPVLVDCWAPWCGPCRMLAPTLDQLAAESSGRYLIAKLNTDENPATSQAHRIDAIPCMLLFKRGRLIDKLVGLLPKAGIASRLAAAASE